MSSQTTTTQPAADSSKAVPSKAKAATTDVIDPATLLYRRLICVIWYYDSA